MDEMPLRLRDLFSLVLVSLIVYVMHFPGLGYVRIDGVALVIFLFCIYRPEGLSLAIVFAIGLLQDIVSLSPLGQHPLGLCAVAYGVQHIRDHIRMQAILKQGPSILFALLALKFIYSWVAALSFGVLPSLTAMISVLLTLCLWPLVFGVGTFLCRHRRRPGIT